MSQNKASGAAANKWGRSTARKIAAKIGTSMLTSNSNLVKLNGKYVVIKCVGHKTSSVGVTFKNA